MAEEISIFGQFAVLIAQILTLVTIATIVIQSGRWLANRRMPRDYYFFFLIIITVVIMQLIAIYNFSAQNERLTTLEKQNAELNTQQLKLQNTSLSNQQLLLDVHKKLASATVINHTGGEHPVIIDSH